MAKENPEITKAFKQLEEFEKQKTERLEVLRALKADQEKTLNEWQQKLTDSEYDDSVDALTVAAYEVEARRAKKRLTQTVFELQELEDNGILNDKYAYRRTLIDLCKPIAEDTRGVITDLKKAKELTLRASEKIRKANKNLTSLFTGLRQSTGSGDCLETAYSWLQLYMDPASLDGFADSLDKSAKAINTQSNIIGRLGVLRNWDLWQIQTPESVKGLQPCKVTKHVGTIFPEDETFLLVSPEEWGNTDRYDIVTSDGRIESIPVENVQI